MGARPNGSLQQIPTLSVAQARFEPSKLHIPGLKSSAAIKDNKYQ